MIIDENKKLTENQRERSLEKVKEQGFRCGSCGSDDFEVGETLEMGFLFLNEEHGAYMVALSCERPGCETPRTGVRLHESEFLYEE